MPKRQFSVDGPHMQTQGVVAAIARREARAEVCLQHARRALAGLNRGCHIFGVNKGQFSLIDMAAAVLERIGPADVAVWTWCVAEYEMKAVTAFISDGLIRRFRMVMDVAGGKRDGTLVADLQRRFGADCIRLTRTHAKIVSLATEDGWRIVIRGSMNLNKNPRIEQFDVSDDPQVYGLLEDLMGELWRRSPALPVQEVGGSAADDVFAALAEPGGSRTWHRPADGWWLLA